MRCNLPLFPISTYWQDLSFISQLVLFHLTLSFSREGNIINHQFRLECKNANTSVSFRYCTNASKAARTRYYNEKDVGVITTDAYRCASPPVRVQRHFGPTFPQNNADTNSFNPDLESLRCQNNQQIGTNSQNKSSQQPNQCTNHSANMYVTNTTILQMCMLYKTILQTCLLY